MLEHCRALEKWKNNEARKASNVSSQNSSETERSKKQLLLVVVVVMIIEVILNCCSCLLKQPLITDLLPVEVPVCSKGRAVAVKSRVEAERHAAGDDDDEHMSCVQCSIISLQCSLSFALPLRLHCFLSLSLCFSICRLKGKPCGLSCAVFCL